MRKVVFTVLLIVTILTICACASKMKPTLKGFYQTEKDVNGYYIQISINHHDNSFIQYIDNREVDRGIYENLQNNVYRIKSDKQNFEINLNEDNSFEIYILKINNENPILMKNISHTPTTFLTEFDDIEEYKTLVD
ncbi:hypothetical protein EDC18_103346 [Natranaerovirga pectinivora]|uniref:Uncharacterized protein n=1 Tax=Natranaerovirga pectinivora TaxID=682400 RepID=A0A4R3MLU1_9FIRM|nr:hypothetical protein [Natranaerovirga pectinivora]TCT15638.1 hypothetical protein EDC18_103346 [Natranaerovirga pectinivora]